MLLFQAAKGSWKTEKVRGNGSTKTSQNKKQQHVHQPETCLDKQVFGFCVTIFVSSSSELENSADERAAGLRLCEHFSVFGPQKWCGAKRLC